MPKSKVRKSKKKRESAESRKSRQRSRMVNLLLRETKKTLVEENNG